MGASYSLRKFPKPWVVVDWNIIRELGAGVGLPGQFTAVLSDRALVEAINSDNPAAFVAKLDAVLSHPASNQRVLIGRYWDDIASRESHPIRVVTTPEAAIHPQLSAQTLQLQQHGDGVLRLTDAAIAAAREAGDAAAERHENMMREFVEWTRVNRASTYAEGIRATNLDQALAVGNATAEMARLVANHAPRNGLTFDYCTPEWTRELSAFPDRAAVARWLRITFCYAVLALKAPERASRKHRNDYDDAFYAFLSLYTGHLWTKDIVLGRVARLVSNGRVQVHTSWETIPKS